MNLTQMTVSGGVFILFIVVLRALALHHLPKRAFSTLWKIAALRLLLPFTVPVPLGVFAPIQNLPTGGVPIPGTPPVGITAPIPYGTTGESPLPAVWLTGALLTAAYFTVSYVRAARRFRCAAPDDTPAVRRWLAAQKLRRPLQVRQSARIASPLTYGVLHPVILLPKDMDRDDEAALSYILTHEYLHIRHFDNAAKPLFAAVLCVHWFNPLVWVMYILANRDLELSCDERVIDIVGGREKASYALTLINMEETRTRYVSPYSHFSKLAIEERIESIMKYKKASMLTLSLAAVLVVGTTTAFAISPLSQAQQDRQLGTDSATDESTLMSYVNPNDGKTYYSFDNGKTFEAMTDEEFARRFPTPDVEWWTYEEYAAWLEDEKVALQAMLGEKGWTGSRGEFVWTQEIIDESIALYEGILQDIKNGKLYSKSVDGDSDIMLASGGADGGVFVREDGTLVEIDPNSVQAVTWVGANDGTFTPSGSPFTVNKTDAAPSDRNANIEAEDTASPEGAVPSNDSAPAAVPGINIER